MKIDIAKGDLQDIRAVVDDAIYQMEHNHIPSAFGNRPTTMRKFIRHLNRALKKAYGHDCYGDQYYT